MMDFVLQVFNFLFCESLDGAHVFHILDLKVKLIKFTNFQKSLDYPISCFKSFFPIRVLWSEFFLNWFSVRILTLDSLLSIDLYKLHVSIHSLIRLVCCVAFMVSENSARFA